jgi:hypothetical protein
MAHVPERSRRLLRPASGRHHALTPVPTQENRKLTRLGMLGLIAGPIAVLVLFSGGLSGKNIGTVSQAQGTGNHPPLIKTASILPSPLILSGPVSVRVEAQDLDQQTLVFHYRWLVNGQLMNGQTLSALPSQLLRRGDQVAVEVVPFDGVDEGMPFRSLPVTVANTAPIISDVSVDLDHDVQGRRLVAKVDAVDPDHDPISLTYRWRRNETVLKEGEGETTFDLTNFTAKDTVEVEVTASDGTPDGITIVSERFTLSNSSPSIVSIPSPLPKGDLYDYPVRATDPDGDHLTNAQESSPPGMTIDAESGHIHWMIAPETKGSYRVRVVAKDPQGGFAAQDFDLSLVTPPQS